MAGPRNLTEKVKHLNFQSKTLGNAAGELQEQGLEGPAVLVRLEHVELWRGVITHALLLIQSHEISRGGKTTGDPPAGKKAELV